MVKLTFRKIPASVNRHWKKSRCSKSTVATKFSNMTHALVFFSSWKKIRCRLDRWSLLQLLNFEQDVNGGCDRAGICCRKHPECQQTLAMWKPMLGADLHFKTPWKDTEQNIMGRKVMRILQQIYVSKEGAKEEDKERGIPCAWSTALIFWAFSSGGEPFQLEQSRPRQRKEKKSRVSP